MSNLKKMKQTKKAKQEYKHPIIDFLVSEEPKTKQEISDALHIYGDRKVRDAIAVCSMHYPIIAVSSKKGYRRAKAIDDLSGNELLLEIDEVEHQLNELKSRVDCLKKRLKPLIAYKKVAEKKRDGNL